VAIDIAPHQGHEQIARLASAGIGRARLHEDVVGSKEFGAWQ
jgi:hypothetical protein